MTPTDEDRVEESTDAEHESPFAWEWRVMAVSAVWAIPGTLFGALVRLFVPDGGPGVWWLAGGAIFGAIVGGLLEADHLI